MLRVAVFIFEYLVQQQEQRGDPAANFQKIYLRRRPLEKRVFFLIDRTNEVDPQVGDHPSPGIYLKRTACLRKLLTIHR